MARPCRLLIILTTLALAACGTTTVTPSPVPSPAPNATATVAPSAPAPAATSGTEAPAVDPADFVAGIDNPWFPLISGTVLTYKGNKDNEAVVDVFEITGETKVIDGVTCEVIHDTLSAGGAVIEKTDDWYAQDRSGNVWYFGEETAEYDAQGKVTSTEGSWQAGVDGARPGIFMPGSPQIGQSFQQEFYAGQAEDRFVVLLLSAAIEVPFGTFKEALLTAEWTPLEPDVLSEKAYVSGVGEVSERDVAGGNESLQLVEVRKP